MRFTSSIYCCSIAVLLLALLGTDSSAQNADITLLRDINLHRNKSLDRVMIDVTNSTYVVLAAVPATELIAGYATHDKQTIRNGWVTVGGLAFTGIIAYSLKYGVNRTAPYITYPDLQPYETEVSPSFPSGHAAFSFFSATSLSLCYPKWYVIAPSYLWAAAVSYSRLDLGVHYPSDVVAGAIIGAGSAWVAYKANKWLLHRKKHNNVKM